MVKTQPEARNRSSSLTGWIQVALSAVVLIGGLFKIMRDVETHGKLLEEHTQQLKEQGTSIKKTEIDYAVIKTTLEFMDKKVTDIQTKVDKMVKPSDGMTYFDPFDDGTRPSSTRLIGSIPKG